MKKILFVCEGNNFSTGAFEFLKLLNDYEPICATGFFFSQIDFQQLVSVPNIPIAQPYFKLKEEEQKVVNKSKNEFEKLCRQAGIRYNIHDEQEEWIADIFGKETRFADLAIISEEFFCSGISTRQPNVFLQEALHISECPVILVPEHFKSIDRIVIAYDGKKESMHALKQFCYLFPLLTDKPVEFVYVKNENTDDIPDINLIKEYSRLHFGSIGISKLHFDAQKYFSSWVEDKKNALLIAGAFSRSAISTTIKKSFVDEIIGDHTMPVFVSH